MLLLPFVHFVERRGRPLQPHLFRPVQVPARRFAISFPHGEGSASIDGLGGIAGLLEISACRFEVVAANGCAGCVQVGYFIVREHAHGRLKDVGELPTVPSAEPTFIAPDEVAWNLPPESSAKPFSPISKAYASVVEIVPPLIIALPPSIRTPTPVL